MISTIGQVKQEISSTAICTKFVSTYTCIFLNDGESEFIEIQPNLVWKYR